MLAHPEAFSFKAKLFYNDQYITNMIMLTNTPALFCLLKKKTTKKKKQQKNNKKQWF
jgi:hypothetical protein